MSRNYYPFSIGRGRVRAPAPRNSRIGVGSILVLLGAGWLGGACGPVVATPVPEPPVAFDLSHVGEGGPGVVLNPANDPTVHEIQGASGSVPARATVRVTNLDTNEPVAATTAGEDGAFFATVTVSNGQELRFEWVKDGKRSAPSDAIYTERGTPSGGFDLVPSPRFDCLEVDPKMAIDFSADGSQELAITSHCSAQLTLDNARTRLSLPDFSLETPLPLTIEPGKSASISVKFARNAANFREDVLLVDVNDGSQKIRYPFTLRAD